MNSPVELKFEHALTLHAEANYNQDTRNLMVQKMSRCFSPIEDDLLSPGISPICGPEQQPPFGDNFTFPKAANTGVFKISPTTNLSPIIRMGTSQQQQQQQNQSGDFQTPNGNASLELDLSTSIKMESSMDVSSRSETSTNSNVLNHTMNVAALLKSIGLGAYSEKFAKAGINLEQFFKIKLTDLKRLGLQSDDECNAIIDLLNEFN